MHATPEIEPEATPGLASRSVERARRLGDRGRVLLERIPGFGAVVESFQAEQRAGAPLLAGGLAYRLFFWLVALGLLLAAVLSFWIRESPKSVESTATSFGLAGVATKSAVSAVNSGSHARWYFLIAGSLLLVYFGMGAVRALRVTAILAWRLDPVRMRNALKSSTVFTGIVIVAIAASVTIQWARHHAPGSGLLAILVVGSAFVALGVLAFSLLPHGPIASWRDLLPGAIEVAVGLTCMQLFVVYYMAGKLERSPALYGSLGSSTVVLLWLFILARLLVAGLFLNATVVRRRQTERE